MSYQSYEKEYRDFSPDILKAIRQRYYQKNKERIKAESANYRQANPDKIRAHRKRATLKSQTDIQHRSHLNTKHRELHEKYKSSPQYLIKRRLRARFRNAIRDFGANNKFYSIVDLIGCSLEDFKIYIEEQFVEGMSWSSDVIHLDHKRPCSSYDLTDPEQQKLCFHYTNFQPLFVKDNLSKGSSWTAE